MCIDVAYGGGGGTRIPYGFLFKNDLNEFVYSCSRCDEEFRVGNELELHSIGHDIKVENEVATHPEVSVDFEQAMEVFAEAKLPPPEQAAYSPTPSSSTTVARTSRSARNTARRRAKLSKSSAIPSSPPLSLPTSTTVKTETNPADAGTKDEMTVYMPFDAGKLEVDIAKEESDEAEPNDSFLDDDFTPFDDVMDDTSSDEDFFTPTTIKQAKKQKEAAEAAATAAKATSSSRKSYKKKKKTTTTLTPKEEKVAKKNRECHCDICARIFTSLARIRQHMYAGHVKEKKPPKRPPSPTLCTLCGKHIRDMKTHLKIFHSTERPFKCDYCDATFKQKVHRDTHVRQHTGEKPYICHLCGRSYHAQSVLNAHMNRYHLHLKPHKCDQCGHAYRQLYELRDHINLHHLNQKMYQCETCNRRFGTRKHLHQHQLSHGEKRFQCKFCDQKFATTSGRRGHEIRNHGAI